MIKKEELLRRLKKRDATIKSLRKKIKGQGPSEVNKARRETGNVQDALARLSTEKSNLEKENKRLTELVSSLSTAQTAARGRTYAWEVKAKAYLAAHKNIVDALYEDICRIGK